jgi:hypothetical protein
MPGKGDWFLSGHFFERNLIPSACCYEIVRLFLYPPMVSGDRSDDGIGSCIL